MVKGCAAYGCSNRYSPHSNLTWHKFPLRIKHLCNEWIKNVRRENWKPCSSSVLCSQHFTPDCFYSRYQDSDSRVRLRAHAIPTIFNVPPRLQKSENKRRLLIRNPETSASSSDSNQNVSTLSAAEINAEHAYTVSLRFSFDGVEPSAGQENCQFLRKKQKSCKQKLRFSEQKQELIKDILQNLKEERYLTDDAFSVIVDVLPDATAALFRNAAKNCRRTNGRCYDEELKRFAMSLYFYSPKAYEFIREKLFLPHPSTMHQWFKSINGHSGFTEEVFSTLKNLSATAGKRFLCCLSIDEMAIRKQVLFNGKTFTGYVDYGTGISANENLSAAKEALVFMLVCLEDSWKVPVAYFLIDAISGAQKAEFLTVCLQKLYVVGIDVVATVCDGLSSNFAMYRLLGAVIQPEGLVCTFSHPSNENLKVCAMFDVCHMMKLLRNLLAQYLVLFDDTRNIICWEYITKLHELQYEQLLTAGNKLKRDHIEWYKQRMKVKLATQVFSRSVSDALDFVKKIGVPGFQNCGATIKFLKDIDTLFDICNSRNPYAKGYKAPITSVSRDLWEPHLQDTRKMLLNLRVNAKIQVHETNRRTFILGFLTSIDSVLYLADTYLDKRLKYLLTYKLSQDHVELFFGGIRSKGGYNNNPNVVQFRSAYQQMIVTRLVSMQKTGNCLPLVAMKMLPLASNKCSDGTVVDVVTTCHTRHSSSEMLLSGTEIVELDHDYAVVYKSIKSLSLYTENVVFYISGFVSRKLFKKISCPDCKVALVDLNQELVHSSASVLINVKDRGQLVHPSRSVYVVAKMTERNLRVEDLPSPTTNLLKMQCTILRDLQGMNIFNDLDYHIRDSELDIRLDDHVTTLKKFIIREYLLIRYHHAERVFAQDLKGTSVRKTFTKLIHFKHQ